MNTRIMLDYLAELSENNNREWYREHKKNIKKLRNSLNSLCRS